VKIKTKCKIEFFFKKKRATHLGRGAGKRGRRATADAESRGVQSDLP
jgi:hypothetical protein